MVVSFSIGSKSRAVINRLSKTADNVDFHTYSTMPELIKEATLRHISFNRIVFSSEILDKRNPDSDLRALNDFIQNFSSQTELVFIIKGTEEAGELEELFKSMFNSPLYTPVIMKTANSKILLELIEEDITQLKTRYYTLVDKEDKVLVSSNAEKEEKVEETVVEEPPQKKKKGIFDGMFNRQAKKEELLREIAKSKQEQQNMATEDTEITPEVSSTFSDGPESISTGNMGDNAREEQHKDLSESSSFGSTEKVRPVIEAENSPKEFSVSDDEDEMLSLGDFGEKHSDTGFLDEDEEEELKRFAESRERGNSSEESIDWGTIEENIVDTTKQEIRRSEFVEKPIVKTVERRSSNVKQVGNTHIDLVLGVKGSGATQEIVDEAVRLVEKESKRVLIVDLDTKENGLLSYIDTERFYIEGANNGFEKLRVYTEDGVDVLSNGYGKEVTSRMLVNLLKGGLIRKYDMIFIDCPIECLKIFNEELIKICNILIIVGNTVTDLVSTSKELTDRNNVAYDVERYISENCEVEVVGGKLSADDLAFVNKTCLFSNGNWLLRVES